MSQLENKGEYRFKWKKKKRGKGEKVTDKNLQIKTNDNKNILYILYLLHWLFYV